MSSPTTGLEGRLCDACDDTGWAEGGVDRVSKWPTFWPCSCPRGQHLPKDQVRVGSDRSRAAWTHVNNIDATRPEDTLWVKGWRVPAVFDADNVDASRQQEVG